jgi:hypothetical protein
MKIPAKQDTAYQDFFNIVEELKTSIPNIDSQSSNYSNMQLTGKELPPKTTPSYC